MDTITLGPCSPPAAPCVATVGFFDGVHRGHRFLIGRMVDEARRRGLSSAVVTFDRHPREVLRSDFRPQSLTTLDEKCALLAQTGADRCVVVPFTKALAAMDALTFMDTVLRKRLAVRVLVTGYDNRFGHNRSEGFDDYAAYGRQIGIEVLRCEPLVTDGIRVSSSAVRALLQAGRVDTAARCLGYPYTIRGTVVRGEHIGTALGFPTANLAPSAPEKLVPAAGVYAVTASVEGVDRQLCGMMYIGTRPTFDGHATTLETNLFDFHGTIYGRRASLSFIGRLRGGRKFGSAAELADQLRHDARAARQLLSARVR